MKIFSKSVLKRHINEDLKNKLFGLSDDCDASENSEEKFSENVTEAIKCWISIMAPIYGAYSSYKVDMETIKGYMKKYNIPSMKIGDNDAPGILEAKIFAHIIPARLKEIDKLIQLGENIIRYNVDVYDSIYEIIRATIDMIDLEEANKNKDGLDALAKGQDEITAVLEDSLEIINQGKYRGNLALLRVEKGELESKAKLRPIQREIESLKYQTRLDELQRVQRRIAAEEKQVTNEAKKVEIEKKKVAIMGEMQQLKDLKQVLIVEEDNDRIGYGLDEQQ